MKLIAVFVLALCAALPAWSAAGGLLWQVGKCDNSYAEFAIAGHYEKFNETFPSGGSTYELGKGDWSKDWSFIQPGPGDPWAGSREHPFEVVFFLDKRPDPGPYMVLIDLVDAHSWNPPTIRVRVNEKVRTFTARRGVSDVSLTRPENGREQVFKMYIAGGHLVKGRNVANITITSGSWALYDTVLLSKVPNFPRRGDGLVVKPTILFKERNGVLKQIVDASMDLYFDEKRVRVEMASDAGWKVSQEFKNLQSGWTDLEVEVPPVAKEQKVHAKVFVGKEVYQADGTVQPQKRWRIYLMPSTHFDLGYTDIQDGVLRLHRENTDRAIEWLRKYPDFIWNSEGSYLAQDYLARGAHHDEFVTQCKRGGLGVMGFYGNELTGICSNEGLSRLIDYYDYLRRTYGVQSKCAMETDVPTMVGTVPMILAGHGIKYLSHGINMTRAGSGQENIQYPFYWQSPDGSRVLMWKTYGYGQSGDITDREDRGDMRRAMDHVNELISGYAQRKDYPFDAVLLHGGYGDNWPNGPALARVPAEWNARYAYPKLIFCRGSEFFEHIEANFARHLRVITGDGGVWWEDGAGSSALETGKTRVAKEKLVTAEKLATLCDVEFQKSLSGDLAEAWKYALLYDEHTWGADISIQAPESQKTKEQWAVKKSYGDRAAELADKVYDQAAKQFSAGISSDQEAVVVLNPSSWTRSERVDFRAPDGSARTVFAENVPGTGYKLIPISSAVPAAGGEESGDTLDNRFYTITFDKATGAVRSIYDKELKRELVDSSTYGLNSYLYAFGGENEGSSILGYGSTAPKLDIRACSGASFRKSSLPAKQVMSITCTAPNARSYSAEVILYDEQKRIDFVNRLDKILEYKKEAGYFAFPFAFSEPTIRLEIPDGVIRPETDQLAGACRDWYCVQHFLTVANDDAAVAWTALDSPLLTLQDINRGQWYRKLEIRNGNVFAYVFNNYWWTNYRAGQEGPHTFRYSMTSAKSISDLDAKCFGEAVQNPLVCQVISGKAGARAEPSRQLVGVGGDGVVLQAMLPSKYWNGTIIRLREMAGKTTTVPITVTGIGFRKAHLCNLAEEKISELPVRGDVIEVPSRALGLGTVLLER